MSKTGSTSIGRALTWPTIPAAAPDHHRNAGDPMTDQFLERLHAVETRLSNDLSVLWILGGRPSLDAILRDTNQSPTRRPAPTQTGRPGWTVTPNPEHGGVGTTQHAISVEAVGLDLRSMEGRGNIDQS
jgi:hypothetical protein